MRQPRVQLVLGRVNVSDEVTLVLLKTTLETGEGGAALATGAARGVAVGVAVGVDMTGVVVAGRTGRALEEHS